MEKNEVNEAFEILLEEIEAVANAMTRKARRLSGLAIMTKPNPPLRRQPGWLSFVKRSKGSRRNGSGFSRRSRAPEKKKAGANPEPACPAGCVPRRTPSGAPYWKRWWNWAAARPSAKS